MSDSLFGTDGQPDAGTLERALTALNDADPVLGAFIAETPFTLELSVLQNPYRALCRAIIAQQISGAAARSIHERVRKHFKARHFPSPDELIAASVEELRTAGLSRSKAVSLQDLAAKTKTGVVPGLAALKKLPDEAIIERLTEIRGIGVWTVQMMLIFRLGRPDVLASTDYGVRKGFGKLFMKGRMPTPKQVERRGARWAPYRSVASWYMWRALEAP